MASIYTRGRGPPEGNAHEPLEWVSGMQGKTTQRVTHHAKHRKHRPEHNKYTVNTHTNVSTGISRCIEKYG